MIGYDITTDKGEPIVNGKKLEKSSYQPNDEVKQLYARVQQDYYLAYRLQHRTFDEFDGLSLLNRAKRDQETFAAYVGAKYMPQHKRWRWVGRKNTARNKIIGILAHMLAGMLYPMVNAQNQEDEEDKESAKIMRILIEEHLRKAGYEMKFMYMVLTALVNPAVFVEVEYLVAMQRIKKQLGNGEIKVIEAVDTLLTGLNLNIIPIDQILLADFYTGDIQKQPFLIRVNRISWDMARKKYAGKFFGEDGKDLFNYVEAGKTRVLLTGQEHQTLFDIEWTEADRNYVQEINIKYRDEDLDVTFVGGVFMGNTINVYNSNPFVHRRMSLVGDTFESIPVYNIGKTGFEPIDPTGRFAYYKSAANKEYWDDATQNKMHQLLIDGTYLDVIKPILVSGVTKADSVVIAPGATIAAPKDASFTPWQMGPNLAAAMNAIKKNEDDMSGSTVDPILQGQLGAKQTAYATSAALTNAKIMLGNTSFMIADLIRQVGELTVDCEVMHTTQGEIDATVPESLRIKYKTILAKSKEHGKEVTNRIVFTDALLGKNMTEKQKMDRAWQLYEKAGGYGSDQVISEVNPYRFARTVYSLWVDPDKITASAIGLNRDQKMENIKMLTLPFVAPYTDPEAVANEVIEEFGGDNPDRFKRKGAPMNDMLNAVMGQGQDGEVPSPMNPQNIGGQFVAPNALPGKM